jgi:hypothetical protein
MGYGEAQKIFSDGNAGLLHFPAIACKQNRA